jgi:GNAT superfamily N-acetyltransferase
MMSPMNPESVQLRELTAANRESVLALHVRPDQERFVGTVHGALADATDYPQANPWYRAIYANEEPVGFVMISWNCVPQPPEIIGPWFLWKLLIDHRHQGRGYGADAVHAVAGLISDAGAQELLTSCFPELDGSPAPFYERLGFVATGDLDDIGETILRLELHGNDAATTDPGAENND